MIKTKPEQLGIPSTTLSNLLERLDSFSIPLHSVLIARHNQIAMEAYYAPYEATSLHRLFSVTKSFTSIAVGLLTDEGKLSLTDPIIDHFPEYVTESVHPYLQMLTIEHMLKMTTCHATTTYKNKPTGNWVQSYFTTTPTHKPGTVFRYDTSASHVLGALVEKLSGTDLLNYLRNKCLNPIGFSQEAYILKDPFCVSVGGTGLMATPMDLMRFASLVMSRGSYNGTQLLPQPYVDAAVSAQVSTVIHGPIPEERVGYGYQFWRIRGDGFACYGMGGQLAVCLPKQDLIMVITADTQGLQGGNQLIYNALYELVLPYLSDTALAADDEAYQQLTSSISALAIKAEQGCYTNPLTKTLHNKVYQLEDNPHGFTEMGVTFNADSDGGTLFFAIDTSSFHSTKHQINFGFGHTITSMFPIYEQRCCASGVWLSNESLYIKVHLIDECVGTVHFHLTFKDNQLSVYMKKIEETYFNEFNGFLEGHC